jgi:uncharacterized repeat protein (TIGR03803 family)
LSNVNGVWTEAVLHSFGAAGDGWSPYAGLLMAGPGIFYGTTQYGGGSGGDGTVFKLFQSGSAWKLKILHSFTGGADGRQPWGTLIEDKSGTLYGTTHFGGVVSKGYSDTGTVFMLLRSGGAWKERVLHTFGTTGDGLWPLAGLRWGPSGELYGTTSEGGSPGPGTVFELTSSGSTWTESVLHAFGNSGDGIVPQGSVVLDKNGALYGTTFEGGANNLGTVWKIMP